MNPNPLIDVLEANRLLRSPNEVALFEQTLEKLAQNPDPTDLPNLHLILDDASEQPEVMFSLVHFLESFEVLEQVHVFIQVMPELVKRAVEWTTILYSRMMNDEIARLMFEEEVRSMKDQKQDEIHQLLLLISEKSSSEQRTKVA
ncbi:MAG: hypothetical protein HC881_01565 [Leptolyngbyaceae cyanobacterium SL_7_1]|nr:hypothetical protein [Leptolyngbyaceae cyanobacterium SL_7_1]